MGFSEWYTQCTNVNEAEAMFQFVDDLTANIQACVRTQKPVNLQSAMLMAENIDSLFTNVLLNNKQYSKCSVPVPVPAKL